MLVSVPKAKGRDEAVAVAQQAGSAGCATVGVLDSSQFASLRPGYWMTFTGRYGSEAEATGSLRRARVAVKGARVQSVEPVSDAFSSPSCCLLETTIVPSL